MPHAYSTVYSTSSQNNYDTQQATTALTSEIPPHILDNNSNNTIINSTTPAYLFLSSWTYPALTSVNKTSRRGQQASDHTQQRMPGQPDERHSALPSEQENVLLQEPSTVPKSLSASLISSVGTP